MRRSQDLLLKSLGEALRSRRKGKGKLSQQVLSITAGLAPNAVGDLERGNRKIDPEELVRICVALDVPVAVFLEEVKLEQIQALRPVEEKLRERPGSDRPEARRPTAKRSKATPELKVVLFGVGVTRTEGDLGAWIEGLRSLLHPGHGSGQCPWQNSVVEEHAR